MPEVLMYGWDKDAEEWRKVLVNEDGKLIIDPSEIFEDTPTDGETSKAPTSNWAYDIEVAFLAHKNRHDPEDGADPLDTAIPVQVGDANAKGSSHSLARADHIHQKHHAKYTDNEARTAMGAKADANPYHHDRATEWGATEHTAIGDSAPHHAKYLDSEARTAMGAKADDNPYHHDRAEEWGATEHTAIGDAAPHHSRYLDSEAVTAMGVKGDANPLHHDKYTLETHGSDKHTDVTRYKFIPIGSYTTSTYSKVGVWLVAKLDATTPEACYFIFRVPSDFVSFTSLKVVWMGQAGGTLGNDWRCDPQARYAADGEIVTTHSDTPAISTIDVAATSTIYVTDVGFTLAALASGDYVAGEILRVADAAADTWETDINVLGVLLAYTAEQ